VLYRVALYFCFVILDEIQLHPVGLEACRVRGVDGSCAKHLTVESYMVTYAPSGYTYYY